MIDLTGKRFNNLTVLEKAPSRNGSGYWKCICDCGKVCEVNTTKLKNGHIKSCGYVNATAVILK